MVELGIFLEILQAGRLPPPPLPRRGVNRRCGSFLLME